jgi:hypothetical protein
MLKTRTRSNGQVELVYAGYTEAVGQQINDLLEQLAQKLSTLPDPDYQETTNAVRPKSVIQYKGLHTTPKVGQMTQDSEDGKGVEAQLTSRPGTEVGSMASHKSALYQALNNQRGIEITPGHILNHHLYGNGAKPENIAPITKSVNNTMALGIEAVLQRMVLTQNKAVHYTVTVNWPTNTAGRGGTNSLPEDKQLPISIVAKLTEKRFNVKKFQNADQLALNQAMENWENWSEIDSSVTSDTYTLEVPNSAVGLSKFDRLKALRQGEDKSLSWREFFRKHNLARLSPEEREQLKNL